jgi:cytochrome c-type biogenesis protein CcmH
MSARVRPALGAVVLVLLLAPPALAVAYPVRGTEPRTSLTAIEPTVMCAVCGIPLNVAESPQADRERAFIQRLINEGDTADQVRAALVAQYGPSVIAQPATHGFGLVAYIVPVVVVLALVALLVVLLPRWRRRGRAPLPPPERPLDSEERARLDAELARYEG